MDDVEHFLFRKRFVRRPTAGISDVHVFYKSHFETVLAAEGDQVDQFIVIETADNNGIDFDWCHADRFRSIKPIGYPIPVNGPVGDLLRAQGRHNLRPAHIHFLIYKPGFKTQFSQVYSSDDPHLENDAQFGVTQALIAHYERHDDARAAPETDLRAPWYTLQRHFVIEPGEAQLPPPPITGKAQGARPALTVLPRRP